MKNKCLILAFALLLPMAACDNASEQAAATEPQAGEVADLIAPEARRAPAPEVTPPAERPTAEPSACPHQDLVGKKYEPGMEDAIKADGTPVRVLYPDSMMTMDHNPYRINIIREHETEIIKEVRCG